MSRDGFVGHIHVRGFGLAARLLGERSGLVGACKVAVRADHGCAKGRKPQRKGAAQAVAGAGDHGDLVVETKQIVEHDAMGQQLRISVFMPRHR